MSKFRLKSEPCGMKLLGSSSIVSPMKPRAQVAMLAGYDEQYGSFRCVCGVSSREIGELRDTMFGLQLEKENDILDQFVKVNELERALELQRKELKAKKLKFKKLICKISKEIGACLQLAVNQLHVGTSSSYSKRQLAYCSLNNGHRVTLLLVLLICFSLQILTLNLA
ncbi:hypothetical protein DVH24_039388 [Malus domestica]|uniref:Uncharacterized protein n=1 Tax=Malus domestica TaxID=3750 RepID=A0A498HYI2_MALDO|nr:hypothetical protein DVH24_039388 [Malus domestica]